MQKTIICHFYNEEYMLPFWIKHHYNIFDHGILINHGSTDSSVSIIKSMAPDWEIVDSNLTVFDPILTDFEVQKIEEKTKGWKICLNISEFLIGDLDNAITYAIKNNIRALSTKGIIMIDPFPHILPSPSMHLVKQKPYGIIESKFYDLLIRPNRLSKYVRYLLGMKVNYSFRSRLLHNHMIGSYMVGRHEWSHSDIKSNSLFVAWYGYSPWNDSFIQRKISFSQKSPPDLTKEFGKQHLLNHLQLDSIYQTHLLFYRIFGISLNNL